MAKISDVYAGDYVSASELPNDRRIGAVIQFAGVEQVGQDQQKKVVLTLAAPDGRPWPRRLVCNKTNAGILAASLGDETGSWSGRSIEVWIEPVMYQGKVVSGIKLAAPAPASTATSAAIPMPGPAAMAGAPASGATWVPPASPGNGAAHTAVMGTQTVPLPVNMPTAPNGGGSIDDDRIPFGACTE